MKLLKIVQAYRSLESLSGINEYHTKEQWALYNLRKQLRSHVDFYNERTKSIAEKYREFADEKGIVSGQPYEDYLKEINELNNLEVDDDYTFIVLPFADGISFTTAESLEDFVEFTME